jgi:PST family polysaccharide transporter
MVRFGGHIALSSLLSYFLTNVDKVLVGFTLGPVALGFYSQAFNLMMKPVYVLTAPLASIMLPSLSRSAVDAASFCSMVLAFLRLVAVATFPTAIGLMVTADEAMTVVGGPEWSPAGGLLAALAATIVPQCFVGVAGTIYMARGLARALMAAAVAMTLVLTAGVVVGYGLGRMYDEPALGVAIGYSLTMFAVVFVPYVVACLRLVDVPVGAWLRQMRDPALASLAMGAIVWTCRLGLQRIVGLPPLGLLAIEMAIGVGTYVVLARREIAWCLDQLRRL